MPEIKRKWDILTKEKRDASVKEIITYFKTERSEEIGVIAAEHILDFFLENIGEDIYNGAIQDAKSLLKNRVENLELEMEELLKS